MMGCFSTKTPTQDHSNSFKIESWILINTCVILCFHSDFVSKHMSNP